MPRTFKMGGEEYEMIYGASVAASKALADMYERLGRPDDPFSPQGEQMMKFILAAWEDLWPEQVIQHRARIKDYREVEMTTREQAHKGTGRSLASIPTPVYRMMKKVFPQFKMDNRDDFIKLAKKYPIFQMASRL